MGQSLNKNLHKAKRAKNDEFYTQLDDIENELRHYKNHFENKVVYCNCDDPRVSNFFHYFSYGFEHLKLKKLISSCYKNQNPDLFSQNEIEKAIYLEYKRDSNGKLVPYPEYMESLKKEPLYRGDKNNPNIPKSEDIGIGTFKGDGDFRSEECIELLKKADIVVTNPPFSLFREYVEQLIKYDKKFIIIGSMNAITYKEIFTLIKENKLWLGFNSVKKFNQPDGSIKSMGNVIWYTNLNHKKRNEKIFLFRSYNSDKKRYPKYDNYDAINIEKVSDLPKDYDGVMGVPISFMDKYNPEQFEIVCFDYEIKQGLFPELINKNWEGKVDRAYLNGKRLYSRILIKNKKIEK